ncbi:ATP-binding protein [Streptomyces evansiae]|uniref:ATP-binding protein n=1 Tax=Streptomyces evansiae TaxID=3075535 RepID=UPI002884CA43|nr:ATP-binding protein [Streptomyces sp. DSM 41859]MDT0422977.1 ATP-binding protein [Streptomyces sp. DSM 41859]
MAIAAQHDVRLHEEELSVEPTQLAEARRTVDAVLREWGYEQDLRSSALLCVAELLANVFQHADSRKCTLCLESSPSCVRIVVSDGSSVMPQVREPDWHAESGRGIWLVSETADLWGATPRKDGAGKDVWLEFRSAEGAA